MLQRLKLVMIFILFLLMACSNQQGEQGKEGSGSTPYMNLSTNEESEHEETPLDTPLNELIEEREQQEEDVELDNPIHNGEVEGEKPEQSEQNQEMPPEQEQQNQQDLQKALPTDPVPIEEIYESDQHEKEQLNIQEKLPFNNFKERWNAVSEADFSWLYITSFTESKNDVSVTYHAVLNDYLELSVVTAGEYVQSIEILARGNINITSMLTSWSQLIKIMHPELEIQDVDAFFNNIGIGPDGDLSKLKTGSFPYEYIKYDVKRIEDGYIFRGTYT